MEESVNHPKHYAGNGGLEVIDAMVGIYGEEATRIFCRLNAFKYLSRAGKKGIATTDLQKAVWYIQKEIELLK